MNYKKVILALFILGTSLAYGINDVSGNELTIDDIGTVVYDSGVVHDGEIYTNDGIKIRDKSVLIDVMLKEEAGEKTLEEE